MSHPSALDNKNAFLWAYYVKKLTTIVPIYFKNKIPIMSIQRLNGKSSLYALSLCIDYTIKGSPIDSVIPCCQTTSCQVLSI